MVLRMNILLIKPDNYLPYVVCGPWHEIYYGLYHSVQRQFSPTNPTVVFLNTLYIYKIIVLWQIAYPNTFSSWDKHIKLHCHGAEQTKSHYLNKYWTLSAAKKISIVLKYMIHSSNHIHICLTDVTTAAKYWRDVPLTTTILTAQFRK